MSDSVVAGPRTVDVPSPENSAQPDSAGESSASRPLLPRTRRWIQQRVLRPFYFDAGDWRKTVFLAGTGRSGTTWIQDLINCDRSYRIMFEPFYRLKTPAIRNWREHQYIPPENREERFHEPARQILSGRVRSLWVDKFNTRRLVSRRIIKDIRAGLFVYWIKRHFPEIPVILALRNPFAVVHSQLQAGWDVDMEDYLSQPQLMTDHLAPWEDQLRSAKTPLERNFVRWCVENVVPLRQFSPTQWLLVAYEECCTSSETVNERLCQFLGRPVRPLSESLLHKPSAATRPGSAISHGGPLLRPASAFFTRAQIESGLRILRAFGMDAVYDDSIELRMPVDAVSPHFSVNREQPAQ